MEQELFMRVVPWLFLFSNAYVKSLSPSAAEKIFVTYSRSEKEVPLSSYMLNLASSKLSKMLSKTLGMTPFCSGDDPTRVYVLPEAVLP